MQLSSHLLSFVTLLFISFICAPVAAFAVPWSNNNQFSPTQRHSATTEQPQKLRSVFPQLTWLRDTAIEKIFGLPRNTAKAGLDKPSSLSRPTSTQLPATLLAKYGGDVVLRFNLSTAQEEKALAEAADTLFLDVWEFTNNWADIRLRQDDVPSLLGLLPKSLQTAHSNLMPDLANTIYQTYPSIAFGEPSFPPTHLDRSFTPSLKTSDGVENIFFRDYQPYSVIVPWMRLMASMFTTHVRMIDIGTTYEGRDIHALRVGVSPNLPQDNPEPRKTIIVSGGFHAREWISVSTVTYVAWSLITSYGKSPGITKLLQEFDFVFIPTTNPDGYVYTWENDRLWRKNRQQTSLRFCRGLDLDRGFGFEWDGTTYQSNPCSESYPGDEPFQAVESHRLAEWAKNETENNGVTFVGFLDLHSYSQQVLYPYSYSCAANPPTLEYLEELGMGLAKAIRISSGQQYNVASACEGAVSSKLKPAKGGFRMETGGGSAIDWFYHEMHVRYSYQIKLRDTGSYGFLLPKENIVPTGEEAFNALKYFGDFLLGNKGIESKLLEELHQGPVADVKVEVEIVELDDDIEYDAEDVNWELRRRRR
ncbi:putative metallocarboxypeptidase ecm14 [Mollisia scopiformis]|uniref:Inactive metallocarboxypeptidase ECM14 n=1 Tax=Mollisia scopiformis TaxID=149040 RepID=A0A194XG74_MOLSC|nr:putative metallocarboxypeptidase ecm14 [Mollisia scopiformis]KUJ19129.1 putative metallocarboxypeptidase ecm14 [Mollisia scopiformis]